MPDKWDKYIVKETQAPIKENKWSKYAVSEETTPIIIPEKSRIAFEHNNPGNLIYVGQKGAIEGENKIGGGKWAKFETPNEGYKALISDIKAKQEGRTRTGLTGESTLFDFISKYAPETENNVEKYVRNVTRELGVGIDTKIKDIDSTSLAKTIARLESGTVINIPEPKEEKFSEITHTPPKTEVRQDKTAYSQFRHPLSIDQKPEEFIGEDVVSYFKADGDMPVQSLGEYLKEKGITPKDIGLKEGINLERRLRDGERESFNNIIELKGLSKQPTSYFWGTVGAINRGTSDFFRTLDAAATTVGDITGAKKGGGFRYIANVLESVAEKDETRMPDTRAGRLLTNLGNMEGLFLELAITPEFKLGKIIKVPRILTQMVGSGFVNRYADAVEEDANAVEKITEGLKGAGIGAKDAGILIALGYSSGLIGKTITQATGMPLLGTTTAAGSNAVGFGGSNAIEQLITKGDIDWREVETSFDIGLAFGLKDVAQYAGTRALGNFATSSPGAMEIAKNIKEPIGKLREKAFELRIESKTEENSQKKAALEAQANILDNLADLKIMGEEVARDPEKFKKAIENDKTLKPEEKEVFFEKIEEFAQTFSDKPDTKLTEIDKKKQIEKEKLTEKKEELIEKEEVKISEEEKSSQKKEPEVIDIEQKIKIKEEKEAKDAEKIKGETKKAVPEEGAEGKEPGQRSIRDTAKDRESEKKVKSKTKKDGRDDKKKMQGLQTQEKDLEGKQTKPTAEEITKEDQSKIKKTKKEEGLLKIPSPVLKRAKKSFDTSKENLSEADASIESFKTIERSHWYKKLKKEQQEKVKQDYFNVTTERFTERPTEKKTREKKPSEKVPKELQVINQWQEYKKSLGERGKAARTQLKETKEDLHFSAESLRKFIDTNKTELRRLKGINITTALKTLTSERITEKQVKDIESKLEKVIERNEKRVAKEEFKRLDKMIVDFKPFVTVSGIKRSRAGLKGEKFKEDMKEALAVKEENKEAELKKIKDNIDELEAKLNNAFEAEKENIQFQIEELRQTYNIIDFYGGLQKASVKELEIAQDAFKDESKMYTKEHQEWKKTTERAQKTINKNVASDIYGSKKAEEKAKGKKGQVADIEKQRRKGHLFTRVYNKFLGTIASLSKRIDQSYRSVGGGTGALKKLVEGLRKGDSVNLTEENRMKSKLRDGIKSIYGKRWSVNKMIDDSRKKINIKLELKNRDGDTIVHEKQLKQGTAVTMWAAWKYGGSNKKYMERAGMTEEAFKLLDSNLTGNIKEFASFLVENYYNDPVARKKISDTYENLTNSKFPFEENYVPINAKAIVDIPSVGFNNVTAFKGFTKRRRYGDFDFFKNDMFENAIRYTQDYGKFVGLAEPVSKMFSALSSREVRNALQAEGLIAHGEQIKKLIEAGYVGNKERMIGNYLRRVFVGSKIRANLSLAPKQMTSFIASLEGDYGSPTGIMKEWLNLPTQSESRKMAFEILKNSSQFKYRHIADIESITTSETAFRRKLRNKVDPTMFGDKPMQKTAGTLVTLLWNPTQVADKWAISVGGLPVISYNYKTEYKRLKKEGFSEQDAKQGAADKALLVFEKYMNETQQSSRFTDISEMQTGAWRNATFFLNAPMAYSRKIMEKTRNLRRGYINKRADIIKNNPDISNEKAAVKALTGMKAKDFGGLFIYSTALGFLFHIAQKSGSNLINLFSGDEEKIKEALKDDALSTVANTTKGFFPLGQMIEFSKNKFTGKSYGRTEDNIVRTLDDSFQLIEDVGYALKYLTKEDPGDKDREKLEKYVTKSFIDLGAFFGLPTVTMNRLRDAITSEDYDTAGEIIARVYGMRKEDIKVWFDKTDDKKTQRSSYKARKYK